MKLTGHLFLHLWRLKIPQLLLATIILGTASPSLADEDSQAVAAEEDVAIEALSWGYESDFNPRYVWRGIAYSEGSVAQTSTWFTTKGTTFGVWANTNLESVDGKNTNEIDYYVSRELNWRNLTVEPMFQYYTYRHQEDSPSTGELDFKFSLPLGKTTLFSTQAFDVIEYAGAYYGDIGLGLSRTLGSRVEMESAVSLGWGSSKFNETYLGPRKWAVNLAAVDIGLTYTSGNGLYWRPHLSYTRLLDSALRESVDDSSILNLGLAVGMEF